MKYIQQLKVVPNLFSLLRQLGLRRFPRNKAEVAVYFAEEESYRLSDLVVSPSDFYLSWLRVSLYTLTERMRR